MKEDLQRQLVAELVVESLEGLDAFDQEMLALEKGEQSQEMWNNAFRIIHTLKGSSGCIGFGKVESVAHVGESLLTVLRDGRLHADASMISQLLRYSDALREMMRCIEQTGDSGNADHSRLVQDLQALHAGITEPKTEDSGFGFFEEDAPPDDSIAEDAFAVATPVEPAPAPVTPGQTEAARPAAESPGSASAAGTAAAGTPAKAPASETAIRVDIGQIDRLMNLVGELVLARNQIVQCASQQSDPALFASVQRVNLITSELQEGVMKTRMQPIGNIWSKVPRIIRDLCHELGKDIALSMEGNETELDRTIIEAIKDPLTHIIRNAIDHGIEQPAVRVAAAKPAQGRLNLRAFHEGGQVNIEVSDDGRGIDSESVVRKAIQRGLLTQEQATRMTAREKLSLIFLPGLSTAEKITNVSGRGVGMDVVRTNIEKIGGSVELQSDPGRGTRIRIKIPLTLAIIPALIVTSGGDRYAIPAASLVELLRIEGDQVETAVERIHDAQVYRLRGNLLPLVHLAKALEATSLRQPDDAMFLVVLQAEGQQFGLVVDGVNDTEEIVVKPLGREMRSLSVYAGATIMGDGKVALILDVLGLARRSSLLDESARQALKDLLDTERVVEGRKETQSLLVAQVGNNRLAIPLACIARLEEIPASRIERAGRLEVIQYRGRIMTVIRLGAVLGLHSGHAEPADDDSVVKLVVCALADTSLGLIVESIEDIVEESIRIEVREGQPGILGSAVVQQRVTDLLDVAQLAGLAA